MFNVNSNINKAFTIDSSIYDSKEIFELSKEKIFSKTWQYVCERDHIKTPGQCFPFSFIDNYIDEPLLLTRDESDQLHCFSNVCTHRGNILVENPCNVKNLKCRYHGRRFDLNGKFRGMPEFEKAENFPTEEDNLTKVSFDTWQNFIFASLNPVAPLKSFIKEMQDRMYWFDFDSLKFDSSRSRDYLVKANWALYVENYLEGFHIPYVHSSLNAVLDYGDYSQEIYANSNLQLGIGKKGEENFILPSGHIDENKNICAYYYWVFPNMMFNFYPWGVSINIVKPIEVNLTKVSFLTFISDVTKLDKGAGAGLDRVEREDESIVEAVQKGVKSRFYKRGRFSPTREQGVHHFQRLLCDYLNQ
ncbi:MAG TPA: choline monooxygenase [Bacteroidetes bacterium]|nr:choline monooxygenase [Bacteroidota bacterium]HCN36714.1 choline monooxygenase [Bacteroidota bacterium]